MNADLRPSAGRITRSTAAAGLVTTLSVAAIGLLAVPTARSAEAIDEVVVTAQFREQNVQSTPIAITAMSAEQLEERGQTSIVEIATKAPSVNLRESNPQGPSLQAHIRGIGQADFSLAFEPGVGLYERCLYSTLTGSSGSARSERVECCGTAGRWPNSSVVRSSSTPSRTTVGGFVETTLGSYSRGRSWGRISPWFRKSCRAFRRIAQPGWLCEAV
jgi:iron complex outermembrane receptor protein